MNAATIGREELERAMDVARRSNGPLDFGLDPDALDQFERKFTAQQHIDGMIDSTGPETTTTRDVTIAQAFFEVGLAMGIALRRDVDESAGARA